MAECSLCPQEVKTRLEELKALRNSQKSSLKPGYHKIFIDRVVSHPKFEVLIVFRFAEIENTQSTFHSFRYSGRICMQEVMDALIAMRRKSKRRRRHHLYRARRAWKAQRGLGQDCKAPSNRPQ